MQSSSFLRGFSFYYFQILLLTVFKIVENKIVKKIILFLFIVILTTGVSSFLYGQNNFEYVQTPSKETSRVRPNLYYDLPLNIKGYSFLELYMDGKNYLGRTFLTKNVKGVFGVEVHAYYSSFFEDYIGIGPIITIPTKDSTTIFTLSLMPAFTSFKGKYQGNYMLGEFVFFKEFKFHSIGTWRINSFGMINFAAKGGPAWEYGEFYLEKTLGSHFYLGAGADLFCNTKWYPDPDWGLKLGYSF
jgi:hypothetical protein